MNKKHLFAFLEDQDSAALLKFLDAAYARMNTAQRQAVFGRVFQKPKPRPVDGRSLLKQVKQFHRDSLAKAYYAPFNVNSKNFMHVPEKTQQWFDRIGGLLADSARLTKQGDHRYAVQCFGLLYDLVERLNKGEEIAFAEEVGDWMIGKDPKPIIAAYFTSLAATSTPEQYSAAAVPLIREDGYGSFWKKAYKSAIRAANKAQKAHLQAEVKRLGIPTESTPPAA